MTIANTEAWDRICTIGAECGMPQIRRSTVRIWLEVNGRYWVALRGLSDAELTAGFRYLASNLRHVKAPQTFIELLLDRAEMSRIDQERRPVVKTGELCEWCDDGEVVETMTDETMTHYGPVHYEICHPCPECSGGSWLDGKPQSAHGGEYRDGWAPWDWRQGP